MTVNTEDTLRRHLDAVDRLERKFKFATALAGFSAVVSYGSFFYLNAKSPDLRLVLAFVVVTSAIQTALVAARLHLTISQMANTILKAIELTAREQK